MDNNKIYFSQALRSLIIFQLKLAADAIRDLLMSPVSIVMFLLDVVLKPDARQSHYQELMKLGRRTDRWINLFDEYPEDERGVNKRDVDEAEKSRKEE